MHQTLFFQGVQLDFQLWMSCIIIMLIYNLSDFQPNHTQKTVHCRAMSFFTFLVVHLSNLGFKWQNAHKCLRWDGMESVILFTVVYLSKIQSTTSDTGLNLDRQHHHLPWTRGPSLVVSESMGLPKGRRPCH